MANFVKLTLVEGAQDSIWKNMDLVTVIQPMDTAEKKGAYTELWDGGDSPSWKVRETPEEITAKLNGASKSADNDKPTWTTRNGKGAILIPHIGKCIVPDLTSEIPMIWKEAGRYCKERGGELMSLDNGDGFEFARHYKMIDEMLESKGYNKLPEYFWGAQYTASSAWYWFSGSWYYSIKRDTCRVVPVFAI